MSAAERERRFGRVTQRGAEDLYDPTREPVPTELPVGTFVAVSGASVTALATPDSALAATLELAVAYTLDPFLPVNAEREAAAWVASPGIDDPSLTDLTHLPFVTIDEETSKDLDQAVFVERTDSGFTVWYAIADAAHFVRPGMAVWDEALKRGATAYLPGLVVPMLPRALSEDIVSLNEGVDRRAVTFEMRLNERGVCTETVMHRARVRSRCKTWFDAVQAYYDGGDCPSSDDGVRVGLDALKTVGQLRIGLAEERAMASYRRRPLEIELPNNKAVRFVALTGMRNRVDRYNEQISILANVQGALILKNAGNDDRVQAIYRVHGAPPPQAVERLMRQLDAFARAHDLPKSRWVWSGEEPLATWLEELPSDSEHGRLSRAIHRMALLTNVRSTFQAEPARHHGVGEDIYSRFTAPMREIVGIFVHKELCEHLGWAQPSNVTADEALREQVINISHHARSRQSALDRQMNRIVLDQLFAAEAERPMSERTTFPALVLGVTDDKVHVQLDRAPLDVKVYVKHIAEQVGEPLHADPSEIALRNEAGDAIFAVGDTVCLTVVGLDTQTDRWQLTVEKS